jgi:hypothetical protein
MTFTLPSASGKTLGTDNNDLTMLLFWLSTGATNNTRSGGVGVQTGFISLWGVQCEVGSIVTPLVKPDPRQDLANCQRFYQTFPVSLTTYATAGGVFGYAAPFMVAMRGVPTVTVSGPNYTNASAMNASAGTSPLSVSTWASATAQGMASYSGSINASADF